MSDIYWYLISCLDFGESGIENCSIKCKPAINMSSSEMGLDNDISNEISN